MRRRVAIGMSLIEVLLALAILAMAGTAMFQLFTRSYRMVYRSRYASMAAQVARETLEELQQISARPAGDQLFDQALYDPTGSTYPAGREDLRPAAELLQGWQLPAPVVESTFSIGATLLGTSGADADAVTATQELLDDPLLKYPDGYDRLRRSILITKTGIERSLLRARVIVKWEEEGEPVDSPRSAVFETLLIRTDRPTGAP